MEWLSLYFEKISLPLIIDLASQRLTAENS